MTAPTVTTLPPAPSRLSRPTNFVTQATVFLESLPTFRTQVNLLSTYINSKIPNKYNLGKIDGVRSFPDIYQPDLVNTYYDGDSVAFTSWVDSLYTVLDDYSVKINNAATWFDSVLTEKGEAPYDADKIMISGIHEPMRRSQTPQDFNTSGINFSGSCINNMNSLYMSIWYTYIMHCGTEDNGSITDTTIINTNDLGSVADATITYD